MVRANMWLFPRIHPYLVNWTTASIFKSSRITSAESIEKGLNLLLPYTTGSLLAEQQMGEEQVQDLYGNVLEATFLIASKVCVYV